MRPIFSHLLVFALLFALAACGGGAKAPALPDEPFVIPDGGTGSGGGGNPVPPPNPQGPVWDPNAASYGRTALFGAFSSDLVRYKNDTLFCVDADAVETNGARILAYDISGEKPVPSTRFLTTTIRGSDLVDTAGNAADPTKPIGFGFYLNDVLIVNDTLGFVLVNAGGSDSAPGLCNVVAFNPANGTVRQALDIAQLYFGPSTMVDSTGAPAPSVFRQAGAEGMTYIPRKAGSGGRLFVSMSNLVFGAPSYGAVKLPGTIQVFDVVPSSPFPLSVATADGVTPYVIPTQGYNPVALAFLPVPRGNQDPLRRLLVTCAGTTGYDANFNLVPVTPSTIEAFDADSGAMQGVFHMGLTGLAAVRPAIGSDAVGHQVAFYPSSVTGEVYLLRIDGLFRDPVDPGLLAVLRGPLNGIPITAAQAGGPGGNITGIALSSDGRTLAVAGFGDLFAFPQVPGQLFLLSLPEDVVSGSGFGANFTPGSTQFAATAGRTLGNLVLVPNDGSRPDVYVNVSGTLDASFLGNGPASLGTLQTHGLIK